MAESHDTIEQIASYLEALAHDPNALPPFDLDPADLVWMQGLVRAHHGPATNRALRDRIWRRAMAAELGRRLEQHPQASRPKSTSNGHQYPTQEETMTVKARAVLLPPITRPRRDSFRGLWTLVAVAAASVLLAFGVWFFSGGNDQLAPSGAPGDNTSGLAQNAATPTPTQTIPPNPTSIPTAPLVLTSTPIPTAPLVLTSTPIPTAPMPESITPLTLVPTVAPGAAYGMTEQVISAYAADLNLVERLHLEDAALDDLVWSPGGQWLALADGASIRVYDSANLTGAPRLLEGHTAPVQALAFNPYSEILASGDAQGNVMLWNAASGQALQTLDAGDGAVVDLAFNPGGSALLVATEDGGVTALTLP